MDICTVVRLVDSITRALHQQHPQQTTTVQVTRVMLAQIKRKLTINDGRLMVGSTAGYLKAGQE